MATTVDRRTHRLEVRTTEADRLLIDRAVASAGTDLTDFVVTATTTAARRVLADRTEFVLNPTARAEWDRLNARPARDLPELRALMSRPSPFVAE